MRTAVIQLLVDDGDPKQRIKRAVEHIAAEAEAGADLILLPEMWYPGFFGFDRYAELAQPLDGELVATLSAAASDHEVHLLGGSFVEQSEEGLHNTCVLFDRTGELVASYRKVHLFPYGSREADLLARGEELVVADVEGVGIGLSTCYDLRYPELYRGLIDRGAEVFLVVAGWPVPRLDAWRTLGRSRAIENQAGLIACNSAGRQGGAMYLGVSYAYDAWGTPLGQLDDRPGVLRVDLDVEAIRAARDEFPALKGRVLPSP